MRLTTDSCDDGGGSWNSLVTAKLVDSVDLGAEGVGRDSVIEFIILSNVRDRGGEFGHEVLWFKLGFLELFVDEKCILVMD